MNSIPKNRRSIRLKNFDYSQPGFYFITICTRHREPFFGQIENQKMILNEKGLAAKKYGEEIPNHYPIVVLDEFIVMPNHVHGILQIQSEPVGAQHSVPDRNNSFQKTIPKSISMIIRGYKIGVTKWFRTNTDIYQPWQRNFYEHIIRNESSLEKIRSYVRFNPNTWENDRFFV